jgi:hypothetical protein
MTDKTSATGWVVQMSIPGVAVDGSEAVGAAKSPASFKFFNVAIASPHEAVEAVRKKVKASEGAPIRAVRALSATEIAEIGLRPDTVKPA